jgi:glutamine amidotransferase-like uncharacterized protein
MHLPTLTAAEFVQSGGAYLGLCAGAYYATARVVFEPGTPMEVVGDRELAFFPGIGRGCAFPGALPQPTFAQHCCFYLQTLQGP